LGPAFPVKQEAQLTQRSSASADFLFDAPPLREHPQITAQILHIASPETRVPWLHFSADSVGSAAFRFPWRAPKNARIM